MNKIQNSEVAQKFNQIADLLEIDGANPFRVRAYRNAARTLQNLSENVTEAISEHGDLSYLPGIGKDLSSKIDEYVNTGHLKVLEDLEKQVPTILSELLKIPGLGPKRVRLLHSELGITDIKDLKEKVENKEILKIAGFGEKIRLRLLEALSKQEKHPTTRILLSEAKEYSHSLESYLEQNKNVTHCTVAGSYRRRRETVGDLDILVTGENHKKIMDHFLSYPSIDQIISHGDTRSTVVLRSGLQVDLRVVDDTSYGAALLYFTGSKAHNVALRTLAIKKGYKLNEYGMFKGDQITASLKEEDIYRALKMPFIEPELRENNGEIEAALKNKLPVLIQEKDIKGDLHSHTEASDGRNTLSEMAEAAINKGYSYLAITDHSKHVTIANGLDEKRLHKQIHEIDRLNKKFTDFKLLKSCEIDILDDGTLDISDELLAQLDIRVCAVHYKFNLSKAQQTDRIIKAMNNPYFNILAHPTGRLLGKREPYEIDMEKIMKAAKELNRIIEINSQPDRLDISETYCRMAKDFKVKISISTDAHSLSQLNFMHLGIGQARRGWLEKNDVINTLTLNKLNAYLNQ